MAARRRIGWEYVEAWWTTHVAADLQCAACRAAAAPFVSTFSFPSLPTPFPDALCSRQTKTNGIQRTTAAAVIDRDLYTGMSGESDGVVCCRSSPHICPVLLGSTSEQFSWERDMQVCFFFFFFLLPTNRCIKLKPSQAADGRPCQMHEKGETFCSGPSCAFRDRRVLSEVFKQSGENKPAVFV